MTIPVSSHPPRSRAGVGMAVAMVLALWFAIVVWSGARGAFLGRSGAPPMGMAIAFTVPLLLFFAWLRLSRAFRAFVLSLDLCLVAGMHAWRWAGMGFLFLYAYKVLPGSFAVPAALGDMAAGFAAPWMVLGLVRDVRFAAGNTFARWNWFGVVDLVMALGLGASMAMAAPGTVSTAPMAMLPLLIVPAFLVPFFLMLHATALLQVRRMRQAL